MESRILDGGAVARAIREGVAAGAARLAARGVVPGLTAVLVGEDAASATYVRNKEKAACEAGFAGRTLRFPASLPESDLLATIDALNR
ncbi:MAG TPA: tetrahydrofolate dehydrogenase/cyclohydrolase catalytic domain-containing protein, partial [Thermoanaerobaculia bacterium]|nr:tetrahydrofolate dehydrogenase/cyclohydrolase catalytic domain-containing protein [Thermoanaerobaculia bacterium]